MITVAVAAHSPVERRAEKAAVPEKGDVKSMGQSLALDSLIREIGFGIKGFHNDQNHETYNDK